MEPLDRVTVFASGVSNSGEVDPLAFDRERALLAQTMAANPESRIVYFSTCSVTDPDRSETRYVAHKREMETLIAQHPAHVILRLPQVVGRTNNPHTLTNYLADRIRHELPLDVWSHAIRRLIDVDSVAALTVRLLRSGSSNLRDDLVPVEALAMPELVGLMEQVLGKRAIVRPVDKGHGGTADPSLALSLASMAGEDLGPGYSLRTLEKYYGSGHAH